MQLGRTTCNFQQLAALLGFLGLQVRQTGKLV